MAERTAQLKKGQKVALWATAVTLLISVLKGAVGTLFHSKVLVADALHSAADTVAIFASAFGLWLAAREKSRRFPYGLYKAETLVTLIIGALILWAGIELLVDGYHKLFFVPPLVRFPVLPVAVSCLSIVTAFFIARKEKQTGKAINSQSLLANAAESMLDIVSSVVVLFGILMAYWQVPYVEGAIIILISLLILKLGLENAWRSLLVLLDANLDEPLQAQIEQMLLDVPGVKDTEDIKIRQAGPFRMVELKIATNPSITIYQAHAIADEIERQVSQKFTTVESVFVHVEPSHQKNVKAIIPVSEIDGFDSKVYGHFGRAPYFVIVSVDENEAVIDDFYLNEFLDRKRHIGLNVVKVILHYDLDMLFTNRIGEIAFSMLKENFIDIYQIQDEKLTVKTVIELYRQNRLTRILTPTHSIEDSEVESGERFVIK
ncbi:MAG: cation diffusion facilitator family transporter [Candidatus Aminicenantales bacterium]